MGWLKHCNLYLSLGVRLLLPALLLELSFDFFLALLLGRLPGALLHIAVKQHFTIAQPLLHLHHFQLQTRPNLHHQT